MHSLQRFRDREQAGRRLGVRLASYGARSDVVVVGIARGGLVVASEVARALCAPLELVVVRRLVPPGCDEPPFGALVAGGAGVLDEQRLRQSEQRELLGGLAVEAVCDVDRRDALYRRGRPAPSLRGRTVIVVDDCVVSGATMRAAVVAVGQHMPARVVVATPIAPPSPRDELAGEVDDMVCLVTAPCSRSLRPWYESYPSVDDDEVCRLLDEEWGNDLVLSRARPALA